VLFPWITLGVLFLIPFVDPRRPFRILHLDLLVLGVAGALPMRQYISGVKPHGAVAISLVGLAYLAARLLWAGFRPRRRAEPLVPLIPVTWLAVALAVVVCFRVGYVFVDRQLVRDIGVASVSGADRIGSGRELYGEGLKDAVPRGDTYGAFTYLAYVPFEQVFPWGRGLFTSRYDDPDAARAAAITFDVLVMLALFLVGRRLRAGQEGRALGIALSFAWATYPYTLLVLEYSLNDALVALLVLAPLLALSSAAGRGALAALAAATKFAPAIAAPVYAAGTGRRSGRSLMLSAAAFAVVLLVLFLPFIPPGGISELYERTLGYQQARAGENTLWAGLAGIDWLQTLAQAAVIGLALVAALLPRERTPLQVAALAGGLVAAVELTATYWSPTYLVWFAPLALAALFALHDCRPPRLPPRRGRGRARTVAP
jgi:hypothetical protein